MKVGCSCRSRYSDTCSALRSHTLDPLCFTASTWAIIQPLPSVPQCSFFSHFFVANSMKRNNPGRFTNMPFCERIPSGDLAALLDSHISRQRSRRPHDGAGRGDRFRAGRNAVAEARGCHQFEELHLRRLRMSPRGLSSRSFSGSERFHGEKEAGGTIV